MIELYPDQTELLRATRVALSSSRSVLMQLSTGGGKTVISSSMFSGAVSKGKRGLFIVPRREILKQSGNTLDGFGVDHSFISAGYGYNPDSLMHVATVETLSRRLDRAPDKDLVVIDECHHGSASLDKIIRYYKANGAYVVGLSATPKRVDGRGLGCWFDEMVCGRSMRWLIDNRRLSDFRLFAPDRPDLSGIGTVAGDYNRKQLSQRMEDDRVLVGRAVDHYAKHAAGRINITFCTSRKHSGIVNQSFLDAGIPSVCVDGETPDDTRSQIFRALARRELLNVCSVDLLTFGFDLSAAAGMDCCIESMSDLRPTKSLALQMQKYGRALRKKDQPALIFDHANNVHVHGFPDDDREWSLESVEKRTREMKEKADPIRQCERCDFCHRPAPSCPSCGFVYPVQSREVEEVDGELAEAQRKTMARKVQGRARTLDELIAIGRERGYKNPRFWAAKVLGGRH